MKKFFTILRAFFPSKQEWDYNKEFGFKAQFKSSFWSTYSNFSVLFQTRKLPFVLDDEPIDHVVVDAYSLAPMTFEEILLTETARRAEEFAEIVESYSFPLTFPTHFTDREAQQTVDEIGNGCSDLIFALSVASAALRKLNPRNPKGEEQDESLGNKDSRNPGGFDIGYGLDRTELSEYQRDQRRQWREALKQRFTHDR